jgi:ElaB/YqjD/DUF883 family membrane-anchored ribosome-binding protein
MALSQNGIRKDFLEELMDNKSENLAATVTETAEQAINKTQESASEAASKAREIASRVGHKVKELAEKVREKSPHETVRETTYKVADKLESAGSYLEEKDFGNMINDVGSLIRRYPWKSLLIGVGVGFFLARVSSR